MTLPLFHWILVDSGLVSGDAAGEGQASGLASQLTLPVGFVCLSRHASDLVESQRVRSVSRAVACADQVSSAPWPPKISVDLLHPARQPTLGAACAQLQHGNA